MAKRYLVTGGTGFLGSALVRRLIERGNAVRVLDNDFRGSRNRLQHLHGQFEFVAADIRDAEAVSQAARDVDVICHLAFINGTEFFYSQPNLVLDVGVRGMVNVLDACARNGIAELVVASSSEVYHEPPAIPTAEDVPLKIPDPSNPRYSYAAGKIISEVMALNFGRERLQRVVIFRPHNVYGPEMGWEHVIPQFLLRMRSLSAGRSNAVDFPIQGDGEQTRAFVFINDFIDGLELVLEKAKHMETYHIGTEEEISIAHLAEMIAEHYGLQIKVVPGPAAIGGTSRRCPDISKMKQLGYKPKVSLRQGMEIMARWCEANAPHAHSNLAPA